MTNKEGVYFYDVIENVKSQKTREFYERVRTELDEIDKYLAEAIDNAFYYNISPDILKAGQEAANKIQDLNFAMQRWLYCEIQ